MDEEFGEEEESEFGDVENDDDIVEDENGDREVAKNIHVLEVLIWRFGGSWRLLIGVLDIDHDFDMVTGL